MNRNSHRPSVAPDLRSGQAESADRTQRGVPFAGNLVGRYESPGLIVVSLGAPIVEDPNGLVEGYTGDAGVIPLDGALADTGTDSDGNVVLDVPRNIIVDSGGVDTAVITVTGRDEYGVLMVETITLNGTTAVEGKKAFKKISSVSAGASVANGAIIGTGKKLGLPYAPCLGGFIRGRANEDTSDSGTYVAPTRVASTATTNDVRGTYAPAATLDGTLTVEVLMAVENGANGFGLAQYAG